MPSTGHNVGGVLAGPFALIIFTVSAVCCVIIIKMVMRRRANRLSNSNISSSPVEDMSSAQRYGQFLNSLRTSRSHSIHLLLTIDEVDSLPSRIAPNTAMNSIPELPPNYDVAVKYTAASPFPVGPPGQDFSLPPPPYCDVTSTLHQCPSYSGVADSLDDRAVVDGNHCHDSDSSVLDRESAEVVLDHDSTVVSHM